MKSTPKSSFFGQGRRNRADLFGWPDKRESSFAMSRPLAHYRWQAHGEMRSFHQAPVHITRRAA